MPFDLDIKGYYGPEGFISFEEEAPTEEPQKERSLFDSVLSGVARGALIHAPTLAAESIKAYDPEGGIDVVRKGAQSVIDWAESLPERHPILKPDEEELGFAERGVVGAAEALPTSLAPYGAAAAGAAVAGAPGWFVGGLLGTAQLYGVGTYNQEKEAAIEHLEQTRPDLSDEAIKKQANVHGLKQAFVELGGEGVEFIVTSLLFNKAFGTTAGLTVKQGLKEMLGMSAKEFGKRLIADAAVSGATEAGQGYLQAKHAMELGMEAMEPGKAAVESILPAVFLSGGVGLAARSFDHIQRKTILDSLNNLENPELRKKAAGFIHDNLKGENKEVASQWFKEANNYIKNNVAIPVEESAMDLIVRKLNEEAIAEETVAERATVGPTMSQWKAEAQKKKAIKEFEEVFEKEEVTLPPKVAKKFVGKKKVEKVAVKQVEKVSKKYVKESNIEREKIRKRELDKATESLLREFDGGKVPSKSFRKILMDATPSVRKDQAFREDVRKLRKAVETGKIKAETKPIGEVPKFSKDIPVYQRLAESIGRSNQIETLRKIHKEKLSDDKMRDEIVRDGLKEFDIYENFTRKGRVEDARKFAIALQEKASRMMAVGDSASNKLIEKAFKDRGLQLSKLQPEQLRIKAITPDEVRAETSSFLGKRSTANLEKTGRLKIVETPAQLPKEGVPLSVKDIDIVKGVYYKGSIYLAADKIQRGEVEGLIKHEGLHHILDPELQGVTSKSGALGGKKGKALLDNFSNLKEKNTAVRKAFERVPEDTASEIINEEALGYFLENKKNYKLPLHKKIISHIKAWLFRHDFKNLKLNEDDIVNVVTQAIKRAAKKPGVAVKETKQEPKFTKGPVFEGEEIFRSTYQTVKQRAIKSIKNVKNNFEELSVDRYLSIKELIGKESYELHRLTGNPANILSWTLMYGGLTVDKNGGLNTTNPTQKKGLVSMGEKLLGDRFNDFGYWLAEQRGKSLGKREKYLHKGRMEAINKYLYRGLSKKERTDLENKFDKFNKEVFQLENKNILNALQSQGMIDPVLRKKWESDVYLPFNRFFEEEGHDAFIQAPGVNKKNIDPGIRKLTGRDDPIGDPLENIFTNWGNMIDSLQRQIARKKAYEVGKDIKIGDDITLLEGIGSEEQVILRKMGSDLRRKDGVLSFIKNGKPFYFRVNDMGLYTSMLDTNPDQFNNFIFKSFRGAKRLLTEAVTFHPGFKIANFLRGQLSVAIMYRSFKPLISAGRNFMKSMNEHPDAVRLGFSGSAFGKGYIQGDDPKVMAHFVSKIVKSERDGTKGIILSSYKKAMAFWNRLGEASEMAERIGVYGEEIKAGKAHAEAAYSSKDVLDFNLTGKAATIRALTQMIPFLNARMQGLYKLKRVGMEHKKGTLIAGMTLSAATLALYALNKEYNDDEYKDLKDWDRWLYYHVWLGDFHIRIPKPFEIGTIFSTLPEVMADVTTRDDKDAKYFLKFTKHALGEVLAINPIPQLIKPAYEAYNNKSSFTGAAIEGLTLQGLPTGHRADPWSPEFLKAFGKVTGLSPKKTEHIIKGYFSTFGTIAIMGTDAIYRMTADAPTRPKSDFIDYPVLGRFLRKRDEQRGTSYGDEFYKMAKEIEQFANLINHYKNSGDYDLARKLIADNKMKYRLRKRVSRYKSRLSRLRKRLHRVWNDRNMSAEEKDRLRDEITDKQQAIYKKAYEEIKK